MDDAPVCNIVIINRLFSFFGLGCDAGENGVDHDAAAVFADDDFFVESDFELFLRRDAVEAATAGVTLDVDDAETVAGVLADAFEGLESAVVDARFDSFGFLAEGLFFLTGLADDFVELGFLFFEDVSVVGEFFFSSLYLSGFVLDGARVVVDMLFGQFDFERLEFDFFSEQIELAVVADVVELFL